MTLPLSTIRSAWYALKVVGLQAKNTGTPEGQATYERCATHAARLEKHLRMGMLFEEVGAPGPQPSRIEDP